MIQNILTNEKYYGDAVTGKTYTTDPISKKVRKNTGQRPIYHAENHHEGIVPKVIFQRVQVEMARRSSKRKVMQRHGKTEQGKYSARYALSELLVCGECGTPYKRCTWARNGKKRIVWRCVNRLEFGTVYCHNSPTLDEHKIHRAIVEALNRFGAIRQEAVEATLDIVEQVQCPEGEGGESLPALRRRLDELTLRQGELLDEVLANMNDVGLNAQLKDLVEEKQDVLDRIKALQEDELQQTLNASRQREIEEWLAQRPMALTEYDDTFTRRLVERITVVDGETIRVKLRGVDVEIEQKLC